MSDLYTNETKEEFQDRQGEELINKIKTPEEYTGILKGVEGLEPVLKRLIRRLEEQEHENSRLRARIDTLESKVEFISRETL